MKVFIGVAAFASIVSAQSYTQSRAGNGENVSGKPSAGYLLAGGGGTPEAAYRWFAAKAGGGDAVVLRASGADAMNAVLMKTGVVNSATSYVIKAREAASDSALVDAVQKASLLFFAGGDQWNYVRMWKGTPLGEAIQSRIAAGVPIGGSSAGLAIMGEHGFSAEFDTVVSRDALANPFDKRVAIESDFIRIPLLAGIITDTHFAKRDRMGRLLAFLARLGGRASAIAVDEGSALLLEHDGAAKVSGAGRVYFIKPKGAPAVCEAGKPLTFGGLSVYRLDASGSFNVKSWMGMGGTAYQLAVDQGVVSSTQPGGAIY